MDWLINLGYIGLFIGASMAGSLIPVSSDIFMIGVLLAGGDPATCLIVGSLGYWVGSMTSYGIGWMGKLEWLERFKINEERIQQQKRLIDKYGVWVALIPWFPVIGNLSLIALGFFKIKPQAVTLLTLIGCFIRFAIWTLLYLIFADAVIEWVTGE